MQISYIIITHNAIKKRQSGNIISRILLENNLTFAGVSIATITEDFITNYITLIEQNKSNILSTTLSLLINYIKNLLDTEAMFLFFIGNNAKKQTNAIIGDINNECDSDVITMHDTFSSLSTKHFEPNVISSPVFKNDYNYKTTKGEFELILNLLESQPNVPRNNFKNQEQSLVIIKPDMWQNNSLKPGIIIDILSRMGLKMVGCKLHSITSAEAQEFYQPVQDIIRNKILSQTKEQMRSALLREFNLTLEEEQINKLATIINDKHANIQFEELIKFTQKKNINSEIKDSNYRFSCMAIVYQGENAISKIRQAIGVTDPSRAENNTIRKEFGTTIMKNAIHASDSTENATREMEIIKIQHNEIQNIIKNFIEQ